MSDARVLTTEAGPVTLRPVSRETLESLARLFPRLGYMESERGELLALATAHEDRAMRGLRTGYGWYETKDLETAQRVSVLERLRLPHALAAFAKRGFRGVLLAGSCLAHFGGEHCQQGEALFAHIDAPLERPLGDQALPSYEAAFGPGGSGVMLGFVHDRLVLVRPALRDDDLVLLEVARAGFTSVEFVPSSFVLVAPAAGEA